MKNAPVLCIRDSTPEDIDFRFQVYVSTRSQELAGWGWDEPQRHAFLQMQFQLQQSSYTAQYADAKYRIILLGEVPIGHLLFAGGGEECTIVDIALLPDYRNQGIGSRLIRMLQSETVGKKIRLQVLKSSEAKRLYERLHFRVVNETELYIQMIWEIS